MLVSFNNNQLSNFMFELSVYRKLKFKYFLVFCFLIILKDFVSENLFSTLK